MLQGDRLDRYQLIRKIFQAELLMEMDAKAVR